LQQAKTTKEVKTLPALRSWQSVVVAKKPARRIGAEATKAKRQPSKKSI
jgi:hypothetical protein